MRVVAGKLGGCHYDAPSGHKTHPMSDRMKTALFNVLGELDDLEVLDAFAGSGGLGFEAISRGAKSVVSVESDKQAQDVISRNIQQLGLQDQIKLIKANVSAWLENNKKRLFDVVILDPPYDNQQINLLEKLSCLVKTDGLLVLSWPTKVAKPIFTATDLTVIKEKNYGDAQLVFYRRNK